MQNHGPTTRTTTGGMTKISIKEIEQKQKIHPAHHYYHHHHHHQQQHDNQSRSSSDISSLLTTVIDCIHNEEWQKVVNLIEDYPLLARQEVPMTCQGETSTCTLLHLVCSIKCYNNNNYHHQHHTTTTKTSSSSSSNSKYSYPPIFVLDALVSVHPSAILSTDSLGGRLPIHILLLKQGPTPPRPLIQYFINCQSKQWTIQDRDGNVPLHYAAMYCFSSEIFQMILNVYPQACSIFNHKTNRTPLHLLCTRWNATTLTTSVSNKAVIIEQQSNNNNIDNSHQVQQQLQHHHHHHHPVVMTQANLISCINADKSILSCIDKFGRLPLHLIVYHTYPRWDLVQVLMNEYPAGLVMKDNLKRIPLDLATIAAKSQQKMKQQPYYYHDDDDYVVNNNNSNDEKDNKSNNSSSNNNNVMISKLREETIQYQSMKMGLSPLVTRFKLRLNSRRFRRSNSNPLGSRRIDADLVHQCHKTK